MGGCISSTELFWVVFCYICGSFFYKGLCPATDNELEDLRNNEGKNVEIFPKQKPTSKVLPRKMNVPRFRV